MICAGLYYAFLAIFATMSARQIVARIATMLPFWGVYVLILLNTIVCIVRRLPAVTREIGAEPLADHARPRWRRRLQLSDASAQRLVRDIGYRRRPRGDGILGVRRRWGALGTVIFHAAFLLLATGFFATFAYRSERTVAVAVGESLASSNAAPAMIPVPFRVEEIDPAFWRDQLLFTKLTATVLFEDGERSTLKINRPLWVGFGRFIRLTNFGYAPVYELVTPDGRVIESGAVKMSVFPPGQRDHFRLEQFPHRVYLEVYPDVPDDDNPVNKSLNLSNPLIAARVTRGKVVVAEAMVRVGQPIAFEGVQLRFPEVRYFGEFEILEDPGAAFLFGGMLVGFAGLALRAGGRRAEVEWVPEEAGSGELRGYGAAEPPDDEAVARALDTEPANEDVS